MFCSTQKEERDEIPVGFIRTIDPNAAEQVHLFKHHNLEELIDNEMPFFFFY